MASGRSWLLRAALSATLLLVVAGELPLLTAGADDNSHISWLATLLRRLGRIDMVGRTGRDSPSTLSWQKRFELARRTDPSNILGIGTNTDTDTDADTDTDTDADTDTDTDTDTKGEPLTSTDYDNALHLGSGNRPVDEPVFDDTWLERDDSSDDIVYPTKSSSKSALPNNAIQDDDEKWADGVIPYTIASGFSSADRAAIASGVLQLERNTCIRLRARTGGDAYYLRIIRGSGCYSSVGCQKIGGQELSLGDGCLSSGIVVHEMMHAIGFWHEQSRPDRDRFIRINYDNIKSDAVYNFDKYTWQKVRNLSMPYDIGSIMHYGPRAFARDRSRPTITAIGQTSAQMGQRHGLSRIDINKINRLYECDGSGKCKDKNVYCAAWAAAGECAVNSLYMSVHCALSCGTCSEQVKCGNKGKHCRAWAAGGECDRNPTYMESYCRKACGLCSGGGGGGSTADCTDDSEYCKAWAKTGECSSNPSYMRLSCRRACGVCS